MDPVPLPGDDDQLNLHKLTSWKEGVNEGLDAVGAIAALHTLKSNSTEEESLDNGVPCTSAKKTKLIEALTTIAATSWYHVRSTCYELDQDGELRLKVGVVLNFWD
jgi:hypothetical protein